MPTSMSDVQAYMTRIAIMQFVFLRYRYTSKCQMNHNLETTYLPEMSITRTLRNVKGPRRHGGNKDASNMQRPVLVVEVHAMDPYRGP